MTPLAQQLFDRMQSLEAERTAPAHQQAMVIKRILIKTGVITR